MKNFRVLTGLLLVLMFSVSSYAQPAEISMKFTENFLDKMLDAIFVHGGAPEMRLSSIQPAWPDERSVEFIKTSSNTQCDDSIKLMREVNGIRTAIRFRDGKILLPLAFSGSYNPPLIGCVPFSGYAESDLVMYFDEATKKMTARINVGNVSLNGSGGIGGTVIARLVQNSIDKRINPIQILDLNQISFAVPVQNAVKIRMNAVSAKYVVNTGSVDVYVTYEFAKG